MRARESFDILKAHTRARVAAGERLSLSFFLFFFLTESKTFSESVWRRRYYTDAFLHILRVYPQDDDQPGVLYRPCDTYLIDMLGSDVFGPLLSPSHIDTIVEALEHPVALVGWLAQVLSFFFIHAWLERCTTDSNS